MYKIIGLLGLGVILLLSNPVFSEGLDYSPTMYEPIKVTISNTFDDVIYDGEWSFKQEWKASSLDSFRFNENDLILRTAHQDDYMYVLIDVLGDVTNDGFVNVLDIVTIVNFIMGATVPNDLQFCASDFNGDGVINVLDAVLIVNIILDS